MSTLNTHMLFLLEAQKMATPIHVDISFISVVTKSINTNISFDIFKMEYFFY